MTCVAKKDIDQIINYQPGIVTPLFIPEEIPVIFDSSIFEETEITISSGHTMAGLALSPSDLAELVAPQIYDILRKSNVTEQNTTSLN